MRNRIWDVEQRVASIPGVEYTTAAGSRIHGAYYKGNAMSSFTILCLEDGAFIDRLPSQGELSDELSSKLLEVL